MNGRLPSLSISVIAISAVTNPTATVKVKFRYGSPVSFNVADAKVNP